MLTECVIKMVCKFMQARLDELLHGRCLVDGAIHDVVDRLDLHRKSAPPHLFLGHDSVNRTRCINTRDGRSKQDL